jgi:hypothetical protein
MPRMAKADQDEVHKIIKLLESSDLTITAIAERFGVSRTRIRTINRKFGVRSYSGARSRWTVNKTTTGHRPPD